MTIGLAIRSRAMPSRSWLTTGVAVLGVVFTTLVLASRDPGIYRLCLAFAYLTTLTWLAVHDIRTLLAPNRVVFPAIAIALMLSIPLGGGDFVEALLGGIASFTILLVIAIVGRGAMGLGDVKVGAIAGLAVGLHGVPVLFLITFGIGGVFAIAMLVSRLRKRKDVVAFTPLLAISVAVCFAISSVYLVHH